MSTNHSVCLPYSKPRFTGIPEATYADSVMPVLCADAPLSIIHKNINCSFDKKAGTSERFSISIADPWCTGKASKLMREQKIVLTDKLMDSFGLSITDIIRNCLLTDSYTAVAGNINQTTLPNDLKCLFVGFDDEKQCFTYLERDEVAGCREMTLPYERAEELLNKDRELSLLMWVFNAQAKRYELDLQKLTFEIRDYVLSQNSRFQAARDCSFGLNAMADLRDEIQKIADEKGIIPKEYTSQYAFHKTREAEYVRALCDSGVIPEDYRQFSDEISKLNDKFKVCVRNLEQAYSKDDFTSLLYIMDTVHSLEKAKLTEIYEILPELQP